MDTWNYYKKTNKYWICPYKKGLVKIIVLLCLPKKRPNIPEISSSGHAYIQELVVQVDSNVSEASTENGQRL
jgi:hypothetical protein